MATQTEESLNKVEEVITRGNPTLFIELTEEREEQLKELAESEERTISGQVRYLIKEEHRRYKHDKIPF